MENSTFFTYNTPLGYVTLGATGERLSRVAFSEEEFEGEKRPTSATNIASTQLLEYLAGKRRRFDVPLQLNGSDFQISVWKASMDIPYGQTRTPAEIAASLDAPDSFRAVSRAANANPLAVFVPAHRIAPASGREHDATRSAQMREAFRKLEAGFSSI